MDTLEYLMQVLLLDDHLDSLLSSLMTRFFRFHHVIKIYHSNIFFESTITKFSCDSFVESDITEIISCREKDCDIGFFNHLNPQSTMKIRNNGHRVHLRIRCRGQRTTAAYIPQRCGIKSVHFIWLWRLVLVGWSYRKLRENLGKI